MIKNRERGTVFRDNLANSSASNYRILVPVSNPATSDLLLDLAEALARGYRGEIVVLHVVPVGNGPADTESRISAEGRRTILEEYLGHRSPASVPIHTMTRVAKTPAEGIVQTIVEEDCRLVLLGWSGDKSRVSGVSLGEVVDPVTQLAPCTVMVVRPDSINRIRRILVPTAGGPNAALALSLASVLARHYRAQVTALHVSHQPDETQGRQIIASTIARANVHMAIQRRVTVADNIVKGILREARDYDLVLMGATQEAVFQQLLFGTVPEKVARRCPKLVIMVKGYQGPIISSLRRFWINLTEWVNHFRRPNHEDAGNEGE